MDFLFFHFNAFIHYFVILYHQNQVMEFLLSLAHVFL